MARLRGTNVANTTIRGHQHEDGYVAVGNDGHTVVNTLAFDGVFQSMVRTATGLWTGTFKDAYISNLLYFNAVPQLYSTSTPSAMLFTLLSDNVGVTGTTPYALGSTPQVVHWMFSNAASAQGTPADLPPDAGFKYIVGLQVSSAYSIKSY